MTYIFERGDNVDRDPQKMVGMKLEFSKQDHYLSMYVLMYTRVAAACRSGARILPCWRSMPDDAWLIVLRGGYSEESLRSTSSSC
jgi:hypothetical protein